MVGVNLTRVLWKLTRQLLDFKEETLKALLDEIVAQQFDPYLTSVGGSGLGILSPHRTTGSAAYLPPGQVTPPETPSPGGGGVNLCPVFQAKRVLELSQWADSLGRWLYV